MVASESTAVLVAWVAALMIFRACSWVAHPVFVFGGAVVEVGWGGGEIHVLLPVWAVFSLWAEIPIWAGIVNPVWAESIWAHMGGVSVTTVDGGELS